MSSSHITHLTTLFESATSKINQIPFEIYLQFLGLFFAILGHFSFVFQPMIEYQLMHRDYYLYTSLVAPILWTLGILCSSSVLLIFCVPATWLIILVQLFRLSDARFTMGVSYMIWLCFILITYLILFLKS